ncbi:MipA/OmpV family protein [Bacteriovoracaceae bacterium]|nr:MipA/OmpV family protein [Bacteriovoracaceae bacterium]
MLSIRSFIILIIFSLNLSLLIAGELNFGVGYVGIDTYHYRGSDQTKRFDLYVPYLHYRSENIEANNAVINGYFINSRFFSLTMSMGANPNVESEENDARVDMPELNYNFGIGPMAIIHLIKSESIHLQIESNIRREFETDFSLTRGIGYTSNSYLSLRLFGESSEMDLTWGKSYANKSFHQYYYDVDDEYATNERPAYEAEGGYSGEIFIFSFKFRLGPLLVFPFYRADYLANVAFEDSPLFKQRHYQFYGVGLFYIF